MVYSRFDTTHRPNGQKACTMTKTTTTTATTPTDPPAEVGIYSRKLGANRGKCRLWLEGALLADAGYKRGDRFDIEFGLGRVVITRYADGKRKVAGTDSRPIIDTNTNKLADALGITTGARVRVIVSRHAITITPE